MRNENDAKLSITEFMIFTFVTLFIIITCGLVSEVENIEDVQDEKVIIEEISHLGFVNPMPIEMIMSEYRNANWISTNYEGLDYWQKYADQFNIDKNLMLAISIWETGNFTSDNWFDNYNPSGMTCELEYNWADNGFIKFNKVEYGIYRMAQKLKEEYIDLGLDTISLIGSKWCPVGAENDPHGINKYWINGVTKIYNELESE